MWLRSALLISFFLGWYSFAFASPSTRASSWAIRGAVVPSNENERGHYEVGFYTVLGGDGLPVGFPTVQEILPSGKVAFELRIPQQLINGYLYAEFVDSVSGKRTWIVPTSNPWNPQVARLQRAELFLRVPAHGASAAVAEDTFTLNGSVTTLFSTSPIPQGDAVVKVRGRKNSARTRADGSFTLSIPSFRGRISIEVLKPGYHPTVVQIQASEKGNVVIPIASLHAIEQVGLRLGISQGSSLGVVLGKMESESGGALAGATLRLSRPAEGPFYFGVDGLPARDGRTTTADGRFIFLNVQPGTAFLEAEVDSEPVAPVRVSTSEGGELLQKTLRPISGSLSGRIFNPVKRGGAQPVVGARVRVEGSSEWATTDSIGAFRLGPMKWCKDEPLSLITSASHFHNHRYQVNPSNGELRLYAFPALYLQHLADSRDVALDPFLGIVVGRTLGSPVRIEALSDHSSDNFTKDFYFDGKGLMRSTPALTDPRFGTYMLFNVPAGHTHLLGLDSTGTLRFGHSVYAGPSTVNVEVDNPSSR